MKQVLVPILFIALTDVALACPGCIGSNGQDKYLVYILGAFILLTYIPFYFLFRMIKKYKNVNDAIPRQ